MSEKDKHGLKIIKRFPLLYTDYSNTTEFGLYHSPIPIDPSLDYRLQPFIFVTRGSLCPSPDSDTEGHLALNFSKPLSKKVTSDVYHYGESASEMLALSQHYFLSRYTLRRIAVVNLCPNPADTTVDKYLVMAESGATAKSRVILTRAKIEIHY